MGRRIFFGRDAGTIKLRISGLSSIDAKTESDLTKLTFHELMTPMVPKEKGTVAFGGNGDITITLGKSYSDVPFMLMRISDNTLPSFGSVYMRFRKNSQTLTITNSTGRAFNVNWYMYDEFAF